MTAGDDMITQEQSILLGEAANAGFTAQEACAYAGLHDVFIVQTEANELGYAFDQVWEWWEAFTDLAAARTEATRVGGRVVDFNYTPVEEVS
jgi:hypothetical protein